MPPTYNRAPTTEKEPDVSEQEQRDEPQGEEPIEDLEVAEEQTDDVTGGASRTRERRRFNPDVAK